MNQFVSRFRIVLTAVALVFGIAVLGSASVSAHETRVVLTDYSFVVGFVSEPAISGDTNGISIEVTKADVPVEGLADTLQARVIFGDESKDMVLTPVYNTPGAYQATFIPTVAGDYTFQFTGTIEGATIDETFTSSPETFDSVADRAELEFPISANGSSDDRTLTMPLGVGAVVLIAGGLYLVRRRTVEQPGQ